MNAANVIPHGAQRAVSGAKSTHPPGPIAVHVRFDAFELDETNALLLRNGKALALAPKPFGLLCALARQPGSLLTKHTLLDDVWGHEFFSDSVLKTAVSEVRMVLNDHPRRPSFIETVSRRGYRFIAATMAIPLAPISGIDFSGQPSFNSGSELLGKVIAPRRMLGCTCPQPVYATVEEVRYAHDLKLELRARLLRDVAPAPGPCGIAVD